MRRYPVHRTRRSMPAMGALGADWRSVISDVGREVARDQVKGVYFRSQLTPDIEIDANTALGLADPRSFSDAPVSEAMMRITKPAMYVDTNLGVMKLAPWGEPTLNLYPLVVIGGLAGLATTVGILVRALSK